MNTPYQRISRAAVQLEQQQEYSAAARLWRKASEHATKHENAQWCHHRYMFCTNFGQRLERAAKDREAA